eukprot:scaffold29508_cov112-Isochrysis_galbana.AAC.3
MTATPTRPEIAQETSGGPAGSVCDGRSDHSHTRAGLEQLHASRRGPPRRARRSPATSAPKRLRRAGKPLASKRPSGRSGGSVSGSATLEFRAARQSRGQHPCNQHRSGRLRGRIRGAQARATAAMHRSSAHRLPQQGTVQDEVETS